MSRVTILFLLGGLAPAQSQPPAYATTVLAGFRSHLQQDGDPTALGYLQNPGGLAVDQRGGLYYSTGRRQRVTIPPGTYRDTGYFGVRAGDPAGTTRTIYGCTTAGVTAGSCGVTGLMGGYKLAVDRADRLILANPATREIVALFDTGPQVIVVAPAGAEIHSLAPGVSGDIYIASPTQHRVWRVDPQGAFREFAGTGVCGFSGDGGPARDAQLCEPQSLAVDLRGNLYIADAGNHRIRLVQPGGAIRTLAGTAASGVVRDIGPAAEVRLNQPHSVTVDRLGRVFFAEGSLHRIRMVDVDGVLRTVAGIGKMGQSPDREPAVTAALNTPSDLTAASDGRIYFFEGEPSNRRVRRFLPFGALEASAGGGIGDGGPASQAITMEPAGTALGPGGVLYSSDPGLGRVRTIDGTRVINSVSRSGLAAVPWLFERPGAIAFDPGGALYVAETLNDDRFGPYGRISAVGRDGHLRVIAGRPPDLTDPLDSIPEKVAAKDAVLRPVTAIAIDPRGNLLLAEPFHHRIRMIDGAGTLTTFAGHGPPGPVPPGGSMEPRLNGPQGVDVDALGNVLIADTNNHCLRIVSSNEGNAVLRTLAGRCDPAQPPLVRPDHVPALEALLAHPGEVRFGPDGTVYFAEQNRVRAIAADGIARTVAGGLARAGQISVDRNGTLYFPDAGRLLQLDPAPAPPASEVQICKTLTMACGGAVAPGLLVTVFGFGFAPHQSPVDVLAAFRDAAGGKHFAQLLYVDAGRVDLVVPDQVAPGPALLDLTTIWGRSRTIPVEIRRTAPTILAVNAGTPVPLGFWTLNRANGDAAAGGFVECSGSPETCRAKEVARPGKGDLLRLVIFGSGLRGAGEVESLRAQLGSTALHVDSVTPVPELPGFDRIELVVPPLVVDWGLLPLVLASAGGVVPQPLHLLIGEGG